MGRLRWWHLAAAVDDDEQGITLIEVMIATFILSVALLAMASVGSTSLISLRETRDREQATNAASAAIEAARSRDFGALSLAADANPGGLPSDIRTMLGLDGAGTCANGEPIVRDGASTAPVPLTATAGTNDAHTVYTLVTWADDDVTCSAVTGSIKRVTTLVTWTDRGQLLSVRNDTLVAPAGRGLPVPRFELRPPESVVGFTRAQVTGGVTKCVPHLLRNIGAADSYEWELLEVQGLATGAPTKAGSTGWATPNGRFEVTAYFINEPPAPDFDPLVVPDSGARMVDNNANDRPESNEVVAFGDRATIIFCYQVKNQNLGADETFTTIRTVIDVVSRFDERQTERIEHEIRQQPAAVELHLQDRDDTRNHPRGVEGQGNQIIFPPFAMNPLAADPSQTDDRSQLLGAQLLDWSTDIGTTTPGLRLTRDRQNQNDRRNIADWRYQFPAPTRLLAGQPTLRLSIAPDSALLSNVPFPSAGVPMRLEIRLDGLSEAETGNNLIWSAEPVQLNYLHQQEGWVTHNVPLEVTAARNFTAGQRLRVRVICRQDSEERCNLGYDAVSHPSRLRVGFQ